jgi:pSer/pThr/pTyr-binding forkhead associated (FHA) protein
MLKKPKSMTLFFREITSLQSDSKVNFLSKRILIGRAENADITINHPSISHYHLLLTLEDEMVNVMDLNSHSGVIINDKYQKEAQLFEGDILRIGEASFELCQEIASVDQVVVNRDQELEKENVKELRELRQEAMETPPAQGLVLIDGEYCDINFLDDNYQSKDELNLDISPELTQNYIDTEDERDSDDGEETKRFAMHTNANSISITTLVSGNIVSIDYIPEKNGEVLISGDYAKGNRIIYVPGLISDQPVNLLTILDNDITISIPENFVTSATVDDKHSVKLGDDRIFLTLGTLQLAIEKTKAPPSLTRTSFFSLEPEFIKESMKVFGAFFIFMIALLIVDTSIPEPPKKLAIIYKRARKLKTPSPKTAKKNPDKKDTKTGIKKENSPIKEVKFAKKKSVKKKNQKKVAKAKAKPSKKIAKKSAPKKAAKSPVKAYKFNSKKLNKFLATSSNFKASAVTKGGSAQATATNFNAISDVKSAKNGLTGDAPSKLGSDSSGSSSFSSGTKGLSSKRGFNSLEADPKTVVLGSIDPELLRKILQEYIPQFKYCYQQELKTNENAEGVIDLSFRILSSGRVSNIKVTGKKAKFSPSGVSCMSKVLRIIKFPIPKGGGVVDVKQPLNFVSERGSY